MQSLKELYKYGPGPSSSHTIAPKRAIELFKRYYPDITDINVELYGSLSLTGHGHSTDEIIIESFKPHNANVIFKLDWENEFPNGLRIVSTDVCWNVYSLGGGSIEVLEIDEDLNAEIYPELNFNQIKELTNDKYDGDLLKYVLNYEPDVLNWMKTCFEKMCQSVSSGLCDEGLLKGNLKIKKAAKDLYNKAITLEDKNEVNKLKLMAYAYAANEQNASGKEVVTAPTLGSCGVVAALVYYLKNDLKIDEDLIVKGLAVAGVFGNVIKQNATISGAVGGCQAEVGVACAMASALYSYVLGMSIDEIEYAAEMAIEHHLGLTCDPVGGYVIVPCIERNAVAVIRAIDNVSLVKNIYSIKPNIISFDVVVKTMNFTGQKLAIELKETSLGGLAKEYIDHD